MPTIFFQAPITGTLDHSFAFGSTSTMISTANQDDTVISSSNMDKKWTAIELAPIYSVTEFGEQHSEHKGEMNRMLIVSNPSVPLPRGIQYVPKFVTAQEEFDIIKTIREQNFLWEGFDQRRRVQRYHLNEEEPSSTANQTNVDAAPDVLRQLAKRLEQMGRKATHISVEEYAPPPPNGPNQPKKNSKPNGIGPYRPDQVVTTFESSSQHQLCEKCRQQTTAAQLDYQQAHCLDCPFVAYIALNQIAIQHWNRPAQARQANCWSLLTADHYTEVCLQQRSLLIRFDECLYHWRSAPHISDAALNGLSQMESNCEMMFDASAPVILLKFYNHTKTNSAKNKVNGGFIQKNSEVGHQGHDDQEVDDNFGYIHNKPCNVALRASRQAQPMPPMPDLLTIIITTSPIKSNPSTELLERAMETFILAGSDFAYQCRKVIVCGKFPRHAGCDCSCASISETRFGTLCSRQMVSD